MDEHTAKFPNTGTPWVNTVNSSINWVSPCYKHVSSDSNDEKNNMDRTNRLNDPDRKPTVIAKKSAEDNTDNLSPNADASRNSSNTSRISPHNKTKVSID